MAGEAPTTLLAAAWSADGVQDARLSWTVAPAETTLEPVPSRADDEPPEVGGGDHGFVLRVAPRKGLDLWRHTYYEPHMVKDDASILGLRVAGDFMATVRFTLRAKNQFDQAGVCVRVGPEHWCKAGIEWVDGVPRMSVVVTNKFSDWSTQNMQRQLASADGYTEVSASLRVHRIRGSNVAVEWLLGDEARFIRLAHLEMDKEAEVVVGPYAACPLEGGMAMLLRSFDVQQGSTFAH